MLQKQTITIPMGLGINTKVDEKLVEAGSFNLTAENVTFDKVGAVVKRQGMAASPEDYYTKGAAASPSPLFSEAVPPTIVAGYENGAVLRSIAGDYFQQANSNWIKGGDSLPDALLNSKVVMVSDDTLTMSDLDYDSNEGIIAVAGRSSTSLSTGNDTDYAELVLYNIAEKSVIQCGKIFGATSAATFGYVRAGFTRVGGVSYYYLMAVSNTGTLTINIYNKFGQKNATTLTRTSIEPEQYSSFAVCRAADSSSIYVVLPASSTGSGRFLSIAATTINVNTTFSTSITDIGWTSADAVMSGADIKLTVTGGTSCRDIVITTLGVVSSSVSFSASPVTRVSSNVSNPSNFAYIESDDLLIEGFTNSLQNYNTILQSNLVTINGVQFALCRWQEGFGGTSYLLLQVKDSTDHSGKRMFAKFAAGVSSSFGNQTSRIVAINSTTAYFSMPVLISESGGTVNTAIELVEIKIGHNYETGSRSLVGPNLHFAGSQLYEYDGQDLTNSSFPFVPFAPTVDDSVAGSLTGTFNHLVVFKYIDKNGQVTRSSPSSATESTVAAKRFGFTITTQPYGIKSASCIAEIYRTTNGGTIYYLTGEEPFDHFSGSSVVLTFVDNRSDTSLQSRPQLYTTGGVLPNDPPPPCRFVTQGGNRLFLGGLPDANEIAFSKQKLYGEAVAFSDFFRIRFDTSQYNISGGVSALGYMDDKLIVFKENSCFFISGSGPNELGENDSFTQPELISSESGCLEPRSVVLSPKGLMFKSKKGIYLLSRSLEMVYIGAPVELYNSQNVMAANHIPEDNSVKFALSGGSFLVYNYFSEQWSVDTGYTAKDADIINDNFSFLTSDALILQNQEGSFYDDGNPYAMKVKTPWIKVSGIQDFGRIWSATILGKYKSAHTLTVKVYYDYNSATSTTYTIAPLLADSQYQYKIHLAKQKCESIQFEIYDSTQTGTGESMELTALTLEVGLKSGSFKLPASRKY
jgi:hypothetical protein